MPYIRPCTTILQHDSNQLQEIVILRPEERKSRVPKRIFSCAKTCAICLEEFDQSILPPTGELSPPGTPNPKAHPPTTEEHASPSTTDPETGSLPRDPWPTPPVPINPDLHPPSRDLSAPGFSNPEAQPSPEEPSSSTSTNSGPLRYATLHGQ